MVNNRKKALKRKNKEDEEEALKRKYAEVVSMTEMQKQQSNGTTIVPLKWPSF